jgi:hypothetical protein
MSWMAIWRNDSKVRWNAEGGADSLAPELAPILTAATWRYRGRMLDVLAFVLVRVGNQIE